MQVDERQVSGRNSYGRKAEKVRDAGADEQLAPGGGDAEEGQEA